MTKRVLISVSDKAGIVEFAQELKNLVGRLSQQVELRLPLIMLGWIPLLSMMLLVSQK